MKILVMKSEIDQFLENISKKVQDKGYAFLGSNELAIVFDIPNNEFSLEYAEKIAKIFRDKYGFYAKAEFEISSEKKEETLWINIAKDDREWWNHFR